MHWLRWWHGTVNDPKFVWVAHKAETNVATVIAVWAALLEHASQESERGSVEGFDCESYDCSLGVPDGTCKRVMDAMRGKGLLEVSRVAMWAARQPKTEDNSTDRVRAFRERKKAECNDDETACNGNETPCNTDKIRLDKKEEIHVGLAPDVAVVFGHWQTVHGKARAKLDQKRQRLIRSALKLYPAAELCKAIDGYKRSPFHQGKNDRGTVYDDIALMLRDAKQIEQGLRLAEGDEAVRWR